MTLQSAATTPTSTMPTPTTADGNAIVSVDNIAGEDFYRTYFRPKQPLVIKNLAQHWPAMQKWSFEFLSTLNPADAVYIERGNVLQQATDFQQRKFQEYIQSLIAETPMQHTHNGAERAAGNDGTGKQPQEYLSILDIFTLFPELQNDVDFSLLRQYTLKSYVFGWIGPGGTVTGYHIDWADNLLAQIVGRKRIHLVSPDQTQYMYPGQKYDFRATISSVDPDLYDAAQYPLFARVQPLTTVLHPGEVLYIPRGWWHRVESLDPSISVNNFGQDFVGLLFYQARARILHVFHQLGWYRPDCTCHMVIDGQRVAR